MKSLYLSPIRRYRYFYVFVENLKNQNGHHFLKDKFFENWLVYLPYMYEIALSRTIKKIQAFSCFCRKFQNSKWPLYLKIFLKVVIYNTLGVENFAEIPLSLMVKQIGKNLSFLIFGKNSKIQNGRYFWKFFQKLSSIVLKHPGGRKFRRNRSISNG